MIRLKRRVKLPEGSIYKKNKIGPNIDPSGTPHERSAHDDNVSPTDTLDFSWINMKLISLRQSLIVQPTAVLQPLYQEFLRQKATLRSVCNLPYPWNQDQFF